MLSYESQLHGKGKGNDHLSLKKSDRRARFFLSFDACPLQHLDNHVYRYFGLSVRGNLRYLYLYVLDESKISMENEKSREKYRTEGLKKESAWVGKGYK